jgi:amino acid transporter
VNLIFTSYRHIYLSISASSLYNGGGPGVLYGLIAASFFYLFINAGLSELASAIPSSANVYHWAAVTAGRHGRVCSWYAGWWNCFAWIFGATSTTLFGANAVVAIYNLYHPDFVPQRWHSGIALLGLIWLDTAIVLFGQRYIAKLTNISGVVCSLFFLISLLAVVIMPSLPSGAGHASSSFVWTDFQNLTG